MSEEQDVIEQMLAARAQLTASEVPNKVPKRIWVSKHIDKHASHLMVAKMEQLMGGTNYEVDHRELLPPHAFVIEYVDGSTCFFTPQKEETEGCVGCSAALLEE